MRPSSYRINNVPCCANCKFCDYREDYALDLCVYEDDQDNLDDSRNYRGKEMLDFVDDRQVLLTGLCDKYEQISI